MLKFNSQRGKSDTYSVRISDETAGELTKNAFQSIKLENFSSVQLTVLNMDLIALSVVDAFAKQVRVKKDTPYKITMVFSKTVKVLHFTDTEKLDGITYSYHDKM